MFDLMQLLVLRQMLLPRIFGVSTLRHFTCPDKHPKHMDLVRFSVFPVFSTSVVIV